MENTKIKTDNDLISYIKHVGESNFKKCFQCGTCSAVCPLSTEDRPFPRKEMILAGWGMKEQLVSDLDPWLCYYCGECSKNCPRKAEPGELMMSLRRFLISAYDWTGISKILYKSKYAEYIAILIVALGVFIEWAVLFGLSPASGATLAQAVSPDKIDYFFDWPITVFLGVMLTSFIYNMFRKTVLSDNSVKIPFKLYFTEGWSLIFNFFTQYRYAKCDDSEDSFSKKLSQGKYNFWLTHLFLMISYVALFAGIVFFLDWFQSENSFPFLHIILFDYFASIGLMFGTVYFIIKRLTKKIERSKFSHHTDWMFVILLFLTGLSGIVLRAVIVYKFPVSSIFYIYLVHLMILFPMLVIEVPFSKWSHLAYRPVAIYFANLKEKAKSINSAEIS
ncbi:MAG: 4Fe-4S dicluster domain-containing protein [bacterium]